MVLAAEEEKVGTKVSTTISQCNLMLISLIYDCKQPNHRYAGSQQPVTVLDPLTSHMPMIAFVRHRFSCMWSHFEQKVLVDITPNPNPSV
jgi:hypothetical protein